MTWSAQAFIDGLAHYGLIMIVHGTVLALLTWILSTALLSRTKPAFQAVLWTLALIKFLVPPVLPGEMALSGQLNQLANFNITQPAATAPATEGSLPSTVTANPDDAHATLGTSVIRGLIVFYLLVVLALSLRAFFRMTIVVRRIRSLPCAAVTLREQVRTLSDRLGLRNAPDVRTTSEGVAPYVFGLWRPVLVVPERIMQMCGAREVEAFMLHELAHVRRRDLWIRLVHGIAGVVFFFFPPVLWARRRAQYFSEISCDRWALAASNLEAEAYARALLTVTKAMRHVKQPAMALPLVSGGVMERRLREILRGEGKGSPRLSLSAAGMLTVWSLFALMGGSTPEFHRVLEPMPELNVAKLSYFSNGVESDESAPDDRNIASVRKNSSRKGSRAQQEFLGDTLSVESRVPVTRTPQDPKPVETRSHAGSIDKPVQPLTPYEQGYLLARRFAQDKVKRAQGLSGDSDGKEILAGAGKEEYESKLRIEMRLRELIKNPPR